MSQIDQEETVEALVKLIDEFIDKYRVEIKRNNPNPKPILEKIIIAEFHQNDL